MILSVIIVYGEAQMFNKVPAGVRTGSLEAVKNKLKKWVCKSLPID